jgi:hypothetical protein
VKFLLISGHASRLQAATLPRGVNTRRTGAAKEGKNGETKVAVLNQMLRRRVAARAGIHAD